MPSVVEVRRGQGYHIPSSQCYIAHPTLPIGERVQVWGRNTGKVMQCVVADTSQPRDKAHRSRLGEHHSIVRLHQTTKR